MFTQNPRFYRFWSKLDRGFWASGTIGLSTMNLKNDLAIK